MGSRPRKYPDDFKQDALAMIRANPDSTVKEIAERLGVNYWTLSHWYRASVVARKQKKSPKARSRQPGPGGAEHESDEERLERLEAENAALRKTVDQLEMDRAILKKAAAFFAKESE